MLGEILMITGVYSFFAVTDSVKRYFTLKQSVKKLNEESNVLKEEIETNSMNKTPEVKEESSTDVIEKATCDRGLELIKLKKTIEMPPYLNIHGNIFGMSMPIRNAEEGDDVEVNIYSHHEISKGYNKEVLRGFKCSFFNDSGFINDHDELRVITRRWKIPTNKFKMQLPLKYYTIHDRKVYFHRETKRISNETKKLIRNVVMRKRYPFTFTVMGVFGVGSLLIE